MSSRSEWIDAIGREHVLEVANALDLAIQKGRGASGGSFACPACNAERRHASRGDRRLACGVRGDGSGFRCFECDASGDQLHLVAIALCGRRFNELGHDEKTRVREWCETFTRTGTATETAPARPRLDLVLGDPAPEYPPADEVLALLNACHVVTADKRIREWLGSARALDARAIADRSLAAALTFGTACPGWAITGSLEKPGKPWSETGYRLLVPMLDATGALRNVLARYVGPPRSERAPKSRAALGFARRGLVLADEAGRRMLGGLLETHGRDLVVIVCEGEMDLLAFATAPAPDDVCRAVLGIVNGSWSEELAARVPDGATVVVATHNDRDGERYAAKIVDTLASRIAEGALRAERWSAP